MDFSANRPTNIPPGTLGLGSFDLTKPVNVVPTNAETCEALRAAMDGLCGALAFEDNFAMMIDNLIELETHLFRWSLLIMMRPSTISETFGLKRDANRLFGNLLSSCKQYIDHSHSNLPAYFRDDVITTKSIFNAEHSQSLSYRVMEGVRNCVQHTDIGVHQVAMGGTQVRRDDELGLQYHVSLWLDPERLAQAKFHPPHVLKELRDLEALPDLKKITREYVAGLSNAHDRLRLAITPSIADWKASIQDAFCAHRSAFPDDDDGNLVVFRQEGDGSQTRLVEVYRQPIVRLMEMQNLNRTKLNLGKAFVSTAAAPPRSRS